MHRDMQFNFYRRSKRKYPRDQEKGQGGPSPDQETCLSGGAQWGRTLTNDQLGT